LDAINSRNWFLCDGGENANTWNHHPLTPRVPDMRNLFVKGGTLGDNIGTTGGSSTTGDHTLNSSQFPSHTHIYSVARSSGGGAAQGSYLTDVWYDGGTPWTTPTSSSGGSESHNHTGVNPPHFVVAYIIYLGENN